MQRKYVAVPRRSFEQLLQELSYNRMEERLTAALTLDRPGLATHVTKELQW